MEEDMEHEGLRVVPSIISIISVKLRLVGENLETLEDFSDTLRVQVDYNPSNKSCVVEFTDG